MEIIYFFQSETEFSFIDIIFKNNSIGKSGLLFF